MVVFCAAIGPPRAGIWFLRPDLNGVLHLEGLPGSGKSTAAARLAELLLADGQPAAWYVEEAHDHPVMPRARRALCRESNFAQICLNAWRLHSATRQERLTILDGYALQSTVRFMFEQRHSKVAIERYFAAWQALVPAQALVYFWVASPAEHFAAVVADRGENWSRKLYHWVASTPVGKASNWRGEDGFVEFWQQYQDLCLMLVNDAELPSRIVPARSWNDASLCRLAEELLE